jgi:signal peptidase I
MAQESAPLPTPIPPAGVNGTPAAVTTPAPKKKADEPEGPRDMMREVFETVVFVIVLVLLLKLFVAEAFVIPTGSMATTLYGEHFKCTCQECGHKFPIGDRKDLDKFARKGIWYICENCGFIDTDAKMPDFYSSNWSGDRVLVSKYEYHLRNPRRFEIPVFKYPKEPFDENHTAMNYIKRLIGLGEETIGIFSGDVYRTTALKYLDRPRPADSLDLWQKQWTYPSDSDALAFFKKGEFEMIRKGPPQILAERRIVFDLNRQPKSIEDAILKKRWHPSPEQGAGWEMDDAGFHHSGETLGWVRYQHRNPWRANEDKLYCITDNISYNLFAQHPLDNSPFRELNDCIIHNENERAPCQSPNWVSDLMLECDVEISSPDDEVILDLAKGPRRFQVQFKGGQCRLLELSKDKPEPVELGSRETRMKKPGKYHIQFANFDCRMTVWVDGKVLPFSANESDYAPPPPDRRFEPTDQDYEQPARIGSRGNVRCTNVKLWRDVYYTCSDLCNDFVQTFYVQPGHYLALGDNSNSSADSRSWGVVPQRLLLGRAIMVYWGPWRFGVIE